jgi:hypothetical protein
VRVTGGEDSRNDAEASGGAEINRPGRSLIIQNEKEVAAQIDSAKQSHYQIKLNIWELKN